jgi:CHAD domain-containing protein
MKRSHADTSTSLACRTVTGRALTVKRTWRKSETTGIRSLGPAAKSPPHFRADESIHDGLVRISGELIQKAVARIDHGGNNRAEDLHQVRLTMKRLRALLRLVRPVISKALFRRENRRLKRIARSLSSFRDATVSRRTIERLARSASDRGDRRALSLVLSASPKFGPVRGRLRERREAAMRALGRDLLEAGVNFENMLIPAEEWDAIGPGFQDTYRRARNQMLVAIKRGTAEAFHDWRKQVKYLYYQLQLLQPASPQRLRAMVKQLNKLEERLGKDHDLALSRTSLAELPERSCGRSTVKRAINCLEQQRNKLRRESENLGQKFFWEKPGKFAAKLAKRWPAWRCPERREGS